MKDEFLREYSNKILEQRLHYEANAEESDPNDGCSNCHSVKEETQKSECCERVICFRCVRDSIVENQDTCLCGTGLSNAEIFQLYTRLKTPLKEGLMSYLKSNGRKLSELVLIQEKCTDIKGVENQIRLDRTSV